jgi:hypothetical protein
MRSVLVRAIKLKTTVARDHTLRLQLPDDVREGPAEVIVLVPEGTDRPSRTLKDFLAELAAQPRNIRTIEEIDRDLEQERRSWD